MKKRTKRVVKLKKNSKEKKLNLSQKIIISALIAVAFIFIAAITIISLQKISDLKKIEKQEGFGLATSSIFQNPANIEDIYIIETLTEGFDNENLIAGTLGNFESRSLIKFTIPPIEGYIIDGTLEIEVKEIPTPPITLGVYKITTPWDPMNTIWDYPWANRGDYGPELDSIEINDIRIYELDITSAVQEWNTGANNGIILIKKSGTGYATITSSTGTGEIPKLTIEHVSSQPPEITNSITDTTLENPKNIEETIQFTIDWKDQDDNEITAYVCDSEEITPAGCSGNELCTTTSTGTGTPSIGQAQCNYIVQETDTRTTNYWAAICDEESCNIQQNSFYTNHPANILVIQPNGGEIIDKDAGNYEIKFNVLDLDSDPLIASIYHGESPDSTEKPIDENIDLQIYCNDPDLDTSTENDCTYLWNPTGYYGTDNYLTIFIDDSFTISVDSSDDPLDILGIDDPQPPNIIGETIEPDISSGEETTISATVTDVGIGVKNVWATINTIPQTILLMTSTTENNYETIWIAESPGDYEFKINASDGVGNVNNNRDQIPFTVNTPLEPTMRTITPSSSLPYHLIKVEGEIESIDPLKGVYAILNTPGGFSFLQETPKYNYLGNLIEGETKNAEWFLSVPITPGDYNINITYMDQYANNWTTSNLPIEVNFDVSGSSGYSLDIAGYPEAIKDDTYYVEAYFKSGSQLIAPDTIEIRIISPSGNPFIPQPMEKISTGTYNYTFSPADQGIYQTIINATKDSVSYYATSFWKSIGGLADIEILETKSQKIDNLEFVLNMTNKGNAETDFALDCRLNKYEGGEVGEFLAACPEGETFAIFPDQSHLETRILTTDYLGEVRILFTLSYPPPEYTEKAYAWKIFTTEPSGTITPPGGDGGSGGGGGTPTTTPTINQTNETQSTVDPIIPQTNDTTEPPIKPTPTIIQAPETSKTIYWIIIIILGIIALSIIILILILYRMHKKQEIWGFLKKETSTMPTSASTKSKTTPGLFKKPQTKKISFEEKIKKIEEKLKS